MCSRIGLGREPALIVEKTPTSLTEGGLDLERKRECFSADLLVRPLSGSPSNTRDGFAQFGLRRDGFLHRLNNPGPTRFAPYRRVVCG